MSIYYYLGHDRQSTVTKPCKFYMILHEVISNKQSHFDFIFLLSGLTTLLFPSNKTISCHFLLLLFIFVGDFIIWKVNGC